MGRKSENLKISRRIMDSQIKISLFNYLVVAIITVTNDVNFIVGEFSKLLVRIVLSLD